MAEVVRIEVKGLRELGERMRALSKDVNTKIARAATNAGAQVIKKLAQQKAPVSDPSVTPNIPPGNLRDNIYVRRNTKTRLTSQHVVTVRHKGKKLIGKPYQVGVYNEFGTVKMAAQPFMRPAFNQGKGQALEAIKKRLLQRIEKAEKAVK
jgi:HK97 gp10 family phage protein